MLGTKVIPLSLASHIFNTCYKSFNVLICMYSGQLCDMYTSICDLKALQTMLKLTDQDHPLQCLEVRTSSDFGQYTCSFFTDEHCTLFMLYRPSFIQTCSEFELFT